MPKDFDLYANARPGLADGVGPSNFSGVPEGTDKRVHLTRDSARRGQAGVRRQGVIRGLPQGISGQVRSLTTQGLRNAIGRRLRGGRLIK